MSTTPETPVRVLIAGGAYAGVATAVELLNYSHEAGTITPPNKASEGVLTPPTTPRRRVPLQITIVDERDGYVHLIGCPLAFASQRHAEKMWVRYSEIPVLQHPDVTITRASITHVDVDERKARVRPMDPSQGAEVTIEYDYFVAATGLQRVYPVVPQSTTREAYLAEVAAHIKRVQSAEEGVVVVGGGAVGIEMAGEVKTLFPQLKVTLVHSRERLLSAEPLPTDVAEAALMALRDTGVEVLLSQRVVSDDEVDGTEGRKTHRLALSDGSQLRAGHVIRAISRPEPTTSYLPASVLDKDGLVRANPSFQFLPGHKYAAHHLAIGDIIAWAGIKRCGGAIAQGLRAADNLYQHMLFEQDGVAPKIEPWPIDVPGMIGLAVGKIGVSYHPITGMKSGEDQLEYLFGPDLGFDYCWKYMQMAKVW